MNNVASEDLYTGFCVEMFTILWVTCLGLDFLAQVTEVG